MPNLYTLTGNLDDMIGGDGITVTKAYVQNNLERREALVDSTTKAIRLGAKDISFTGGTGHEFAIAGLVGSDSTDLNVPVNTLQYQVVVQYRAGGSAGRHNDTWTSGWFFLVADSDLGDLPTQVTPETAATGADIISAASAEADRAEAAADLATAPTDTQMEALVNDPASATSGALSATYAARNGDATVAPPPDINRHRAQGSVAYLTLPTPDATGQATHPDVLYVPQGFAGYNWWMAYTPYANASDPLENPCIAQSADGVTWTVPAGLTNPIEPYPGGSDYNSDVALVLSLDGSTLYCVFRQVISAVEKIVYKSTTDGVNWSAKATLFTTAGLSTALSPAVIWNGTEWVMFTVEGTTQGARKIQRRTAPDFTGPWSAPADCTITLPDTFAGLDQEPWHIDVIWNSGYYVALVNGKTLPSNGNGENTLAYSRDGITWTAAAQPVIRRSGQAWDNAQYRSSLVPLMDGRFRIYYSGVTSDSLGWRIGVTETQLGAATVTPEGRALFGKRDAVPNGVVNVYQDDGAVPGMVYRPQAAAQAALVVEFRDNTGSVLYGGLTSEAGMKLGGFNGTKANNSGLGVGGYAEFQGHAWFGTTATRSMWLGALADTGGGQRVFAIANCNVAPSATPGNGGVLYVEAGALKWKGSSGTVTTIAPA